MTDFVMPTRNPDLPEGKMDPELKARWVAALRSGEYKQGQNYLCYQGKFCCLGVLEDVAKEDLGTKVEAQTDGTVLYGHGLGAPDTKHCRYYWGHSHIPHVVISGTRESLWSHNDYGNKTFEQLANAIEEQL